MKDTLVIAIVVGFFALCAAYVIWCERVIAADSPGHVVSDATAVGRAASTAGATDTTAPDAAAVASGGGRHVRDE